ncbi:MAG: hypothetical protein PHAS_01749 [Phascolarctobacterium sp.]
MIVVYLIKSEHYIYVEKFCLNKSVLKYGSYLLYALIPIFLCWLAIALIKLQENDTLTGDCIKIESANNVFLPSYLGYFFVSLSINSFDTMIVIYLIILAFTCVSQNQYFNPGFLLLGYKFYFVTTANNVKVFLISQKDIRINNVDLNILKRINDNSYLEVEANKK